MRTIRKISRYLMITALLTLMSAVPASARESETILDGVYVDTIALGGKTEAEARALVSEYVTELEKRNITLLAIDDNTVSITPADIGFTWSNPDIIGEAAALGKAGNVIQRYKAIKDLENKDKVFEVEFTLDTALIADVITEQCEAFNVPAVDATMIRTDGEISVTEGQAGYVIDASASVDIIYDYLQSEWNKEDCTIELAATVQEPRGSAEELSELTDVLGTFETKFVDSGRNRSANLINGCNLINGTLLYPGEEFTTYEAVSPFTESNGYYMAASYLNGQVVDSLGGGICQVSTTLYNAVLLAELEVTERHNHSMIVSYVDRSADAAIAESSGKDFKFINNLEYPIYIEGVTTPEKIVTFTIYGIDDRPAGRTIEYVSEDLERRDPDGENVYQDAGRPVGYVAIQSAHIGYRSRLWKVVRENGEEISREQVNSSSYMVSPRSATVGIATDNPVVLEQIMAAIATNNINHIDAVAKAIQAQLPLPEPPPAAPPEGQPAVPPEGQPAAPPEGQPAVPPEGQPAVPPEGQPAAPPEG